MPLINLNRNNQSTNNPASPQTDSNQEPVNGNNAKDSSELNETQITVSNKLGEDMNLQSNVNVKHNQDGSKEFNYAPSANSQQISPQSPNSNMDISENLQSKINEITPIQINKQTQSADNKTYTNVQTPSPGLDVTNLQLQDYTLEQILSEGIRMKASDIHLTVGYRAIVRVDGKLVKLNTNELTQQNLKDYSSQLINQRKDIDFVKSTEADFSYSFSNRRFRVNIFRELGNLAIVARIVPEKILTIDELGLPQILKDLSKIPGGLILVTGPTGSGKSTTLASILNHVNTNDSKHIITIEDPIEFIFPKAQSLIEQREFGSDFTSWSKALRSILRQDPNIVLVGEMRDHETIASTITISETGHLVFATLHTNSASQTIDRIIDVFPEAQQAQIRAQLANVITAVISQRLVPLVNGGRKAVMEILVANSAVKNAIREAQTHQIDNMIQTGQDFGMISLEKSLVELVRKGLITTDTAKSATVKPDEIDLLLNN